MSSIDRNWNRFSTRKKVLIGAGYLLAAQVFMAALAAVITLLEVL